jgi:acyl carrier protein
MGSETSIREEVRQFLLREFLPGEDPAELTDTTELVSGGILDSLAILKLVSFLEEKFGIEVAAHEADAEHLNTIADIGQLVASKRG